MSAGVPLSGGGSEGPPKVSVPEPTAVELSAREVGQKNTNETAQQKAEEASELADAAKDGSPPVETAKDFLTRDEEVQAAEAEARGENVSNPSTTLPTTQSTEASPEKLNEEPVQASSGDQPSEGPPKNPVAANPVEPGDNSRNGETQAQQLITEIGNPPESPSASSSTESNPASGGMTPPEATGVPTEQAGQTTDEKINNAARELLVRDENAKTYLKTLGIEDIQNLNVAQQITDLESKDGKEGRAKRNEQEEALLRRLKEIHGRAVRKEAEVRLDEMNKGGVDKDSPEYRAAKQQFEDHASDAEKHYIRETIRNDKGLRKMLEKADWYDTEKAGQNLEDFDIERAIQQEGNSRLGKRLQEINDHGHRAVLLDKQQYTKPEEQEGLMREIAETGKHDRGFGRRGLDKLNDFIEQFSGAEIRNAFNQAKGWKIVMKSNEKLLKNPNLSEDDRKRYKENLENAKKLRAAALNEALGKRGLKILFWIFIALSALMVVGPAILPAKLMEWGGKGAGGH